MDRDTAKDWASQFAGIVFMALMALGLWYFLVEMPRQNKAEDAQAAAEVAALEMKVSNNFDNYIKAAPLLKGDTAKALESVVRSKIREMGLDPMDARFADISAAQRWREAQRIAAESDAHIAATDRLIDEEISQCTPLFGADRCKEMIETWHCNAGHHCTQLAWGSFDDIAFDRGYVSEDDLSNACRDL